MILEQSDSIIEKDLSKARINDFSNGFRRQSK